MKIAYQGGVTQTMVGALSVKRNKKRVISHLLMVVVLIVTVMLEVFQGVKDAPLHSASALSVTLG